MTVLVTGGAGYIGSHTVYNLIEAGENVVVVDDLSSGRQSLLPPGVQFVVGSVGDRELLMSVLRLHQVDTIIHFAGSVSVPESIGEPLKYYRNNTANTCTLLELAVDAGVKHFIFSSTAAVYGIAENVPVTEDDLLQPISPYGRSKLMSEVMLADVGKAHGLRSVVLRYFNVAGADPSGRTGQASKQATHLIKVACEAALGKRAKLEIFGDDYPTADGTCVRDYVHVSDLAGAHVVALEYLRCGGESVTLNCGYGRGFSVKEVIGAVQRVSGAEFPIIVAPRRAGDAPALVADVTRIRRQFAWAPRYEDIDVIVAHALAWERQLSC